MEQIVIHFSATDGCTFSFDQAVPVEYKSVEALYLDMKEALKSYKKTHWKKRGSTITVGHLTLDIDVFQNYDGDDVYFEMPGIFSLQEWFNKYKSTEA